MADDILLVVQQVAEQSVGWRGPLPDGDLSAVLDSLQRLSLVVALEDRFQVRLDAEEGEINTVDDLVRILEEKTDV